MNPDAELTLRARHVFPVEGPPIADGRLTIRGGRIAAVGRDVGREADLDLDNAAILPGFVNAHTHLELGPIAPPRGGEPEDEVAWLRRVVDGRLAAGTEGMEAAVRDHLAEALAAGTTMLADTTTAGRSWPAVADAPIRGVVFDELIGLRRLRGLQSSQDAFERLAAIRPPDQVAACARPGLSPHAPYSTAGWLYHRALAAGAPLSTHLAEMPEELELLRTRTGPLRTFLEDLGAWDDDWEPLSTRPIDYIRRGDLRRADWVVAHGNYLEPDDIWQLVPRSPEGPRVAVAYCPRTHARFGHAPHPFRAMLRRGAIVCLGTDSRASAPTLSVLDEARFLRRLDPDLGGPLLLTMATLFGAWALRAETVTGSLVPGKSADLAILPLPDRDAPDPHLLVLDSDLPVAATVFEGDLVAGAWPS